LTRRDIQSDWGCGIYYFGLEVWDGFMRTYGKCNTNRGLAGRLGSYLDAERHLKDNQIHRHNCNSAALAARLSLPHTLARPSDGNP